jgi:mevalonate kinase
MNLLRALIFTEVVMVFVWAPDLTFGQEKQSPSSTGQMKSTGKMSMDEMMKECREHHQSTMKSIDQMTKMMEAAKQSNDPVKMRAALDQGQKQLSEMKEHMSMCGNMMSIMEKMQGMGGMMKGQSK